MNATVERLRLAATGRPRPAARRPAWFGPVALALALSAAGLPALAGEADVKAVKAAREPGGTWRFDVTIRSRDRGWDYYCDRFEVVAPGGKVLATRILLHPHDDEQPFTRELAGVAVPPGVRRVTVRAAMKPGGAGGEVLAADLAP
ncbi:MAG: hypothetical protein AB7I06_02170 [Burkholderiales bacterium]